MSPLSPQPVPVQSDPLTRSSVASSPATNGLLSPLGGQYTFSHSPGTSSPAEGLSLYSASAQLRFLAANLAANADLFWQLQRERKSEGTPVSSKIAPECQIAGLNKPEGNTADHTADLVRESTRESISSSASEYFGTPSISVSVRSASSSSPQVSSQNADIAFVYIHPVRPIDTFAGILLTYNISADNLRKANRLWAHDSIQSRPFLMLPIDNCGILYQLHYKAEESARSDFAASAPESKTESTSPLVDYPLEGWAHVENIGDVEVIRMPKQRLSHFPRRRKNQNQTEEQQGQTTPRGSLDLTQQTSRSSMDSTMSQSSTFSIGNALYKVVRTFQKAPTYSPEDDAIEL